MDGGIEFQSRAGSGFVAQFDLPEGMGTHPSGMLNPEGQRAEQKHAGGVRTNA
jgi:hypothetical protein